MLQKRSVNISGHATSISLEEEFWDQLKTIAKNKRLGLNDLIAEVDESRVGNLSSELRVFVLKDVLARL
ncbi:ribbon-helix-helix domain-containing protein [Magnetospira sp. QH-2]|uniref:ribbon-helix-helix domain-containing protein n=1 Tax=Magnetospira sp. (strain QH-2) TaxID=1288970 RepID=UPI0003E80C95|nr:ribbon-helix-helix domain-containing protein [Magnetospira sp. QH-2]CCQ72820.1 conserved protein of unknown function [Magnetospira sp. QH-2]